MFKYFLITITISVLFTCVCMGQQNQLKGPAAKNQKVWKVSKAFNTFSATTFHKLTGPAAKNSKPWNKEVKYAPIAQIARVQLLGPKAKNTHRFVNREQVDVQVGSLKDYR